MYLQTQEEAKRQERIDAFQRQLRTDYAAYKRELRRAMDIGQGVRLDGLPEGPRQRMTVRMDADPVEQRNDAAIEELVARFIEDSSRCRRKALRRDSGETLLLTSMLKNFVAQFVPSLYIPNKAARDFPVRNDYPRGARVHSFRRIEDHDDDDLGALSNFADDVKMVNISVSEDTFRVLQFARGYAWTIDELEGALFSGVDLPTEGMAALDRASTRVFEKVALQGVSSKNIAGMYNDSNVSIVAEVTGTWSSATADEIVGDCRALIHGPRAATAGQYMPNRLRLPDGRIKYLGIQRTNTDFSVRRVLTEEFPGLQILAGGTREDEYDASSTGPRMMCYPFDPQVLHLAVPMPFSLEPPEKDGFRYKVVGRQILGGAVINIPLAVGYMDDI